jgi:hypothetical protein
MGNDNRKSEIGNRKMGIGIANLATADAIATFQLPISISDFRFPISD